MKQEIMADGPRCKRRKQANPRRKNGKKITGETNQAVGGGDIFGCKPAFEGFHCGSGMCEGPRLVRISAFPFYAGIKGPLSGEKVCVNASVLQPHSSPGTL